VKSKNAARESSSSSSHAVKMGLPETQENLVGDSGNSESRLATCNPNFQSISHLVTDDASRTTTGSLSTVSASAEHSKNTQQTLDMMTVQMTLVR
jgi:hypothetical protein